MGNLTRLWKNYGQEIVKFDYSDIRDKLGNEEYAKCLSENGLPFQTQPGLSFDNELYKDVMYADNFVNADNYFAIGFTDSGEVIAIEKDSGRIVWINSETKQGDIHLINSSLVQFYKCLHEYAVFCITTIGKYGSIDNYTEEDYKVLKDNLRAIDKASCEHTEGANWELWAGQIESLGEKFEG